MLRIRINIIRSRVWRQGLDDSDPDPLLAATQNFANILNLLSKTVKFVMMKPLIKLNKDSQA